MEKVLEAIKEPGVSMDLMMDLAGILVQTGISDPEVNDVDSGR